MAIGDRTILHSTSIPEVPESEGTRRGHTYLPWVDCICAGVPCQDVSIAGLRAGLKGKRTGLLYEFARMLQELRPTWFVFENVPGLLSSNNGRDFAEVLRVFMVECGYGVCWRVLDSQYFGVPQRRRRVFIVGCLGRPCPPEVLFERESLQGDHPPRREARERTPRGVEIGPSGGGFTDLSPTLDARCKDGFIRNQLGVGAVEVCGSVSSKWAKGTGGPAGGECYNLVAHSLRADGFDASDVVGALQSGGSPRGHGTAGTNNQAVAAGHIVPVAIRTAQTSANGHGVAEDVAHTLDGAQGQAVAFQPRIARNGRGAPEEIVPALNGANAGETSDSRPCVMAGMAVRRLTPRECERLQGLEDDYTLVPFRGKLAADGNRYKAIGNGMAVPVVRWIGERISEIDRVFEGRAEYQWRKILMWVRQDGRCCVGGERIHLKDCTFEHQNGRGAGKQDDRITDEHGKPINGVSCAAHNYLRGSRRTPIEHGNNIFVELESL